MNKRKIINNKENLVAFVDFEMNTNGDMPKSKLEVIEFGIVITDDKDIETHRQYVRPISADHIFEYATFITGITSSTLKYSVNFYEMMSNLSYYTRNCKAIYYWGNTDYKVLKNSLDKIRVSQFKWKKMLGKMKCFQEDFLGGYSKTRDCGMVDYAKKIGAIPEDYEQRHRALPDAEVLYRIYKKISEE